MTQNYKATTEESEQSEWTERKRTLFSLMNATQHRPPSGQLGGASLELATAVFNNMFEDCDFIVTTGNFCLKAIFAYLY